MINKDWFTFLQTVCLQDHYSFLENIPTKIDRIVNFGCWTGDEPFALLWTLDSSEITVVEIEHKHLLCFQEELKIVSHRISQSMLGRHVKLLCRDMSQNISELPNRYYDLAYCENVLYYLQDQPNLLKNSISQMIRILRPGGYIVANEPKFGVNFEEREELFMGQKNKRPYPLNEPSDINFLFSSTALIKKDIIQFPKYAYCYQKLH